MIAVPSRPRATLLKYSVHGVADAGEARTDVGGGKIEPPRLFVWLGGASIVPPSHAGAHSIPQIAECMGSVRRPVRRTPRRFVPRATVRAADPRALLILRAELLQ